MNAELQNTFNQLRNLVSQYPYISVGIALVYLLFLIKRTKGTIALTLLAIIGLVVGIWFKQMFTNKDKNSNWIRYNNKRLETYEKSKDIKE